MFRVLRIALGGLLLLTNTFLTSFGIVLFAFLHLLLPGKTLKKAAIMSIDRGVLQMWSYFNHLILSRYAGINIDIQGDPSISRDGWSFVMSNHQSWLDIIVLQLAFAKKLPMIKFFMKKELLWQIPFGGIACWALGFPMIKRYDRAYLRKHPEKKGKDVETIQKACQRSRAYPTAFLSFVEGTRFTKEKHQRQDSPYTHLLKPKPGAIGLTLQALGNSLTSIVDTTVYYDIQPNLLAALAGDMQHIKVRFDVHPVDETMQARCQASRESRKLLNAWIVGLWEKKASLLEQLEQESQPNENA